MIVLSVLARKGGTGKSTAVRCLAVEALKSGRRVVILDLDPQPTCRRWEATCCGEYPCPTGDPPAPAASLARSTDFAPRALI